ncbi:uncharacterized protein LOC131026374 [Salvia miltiorrhiza]|uniref:uncharacterized protein LOC131026374 n=1 Tax=Salvia miltiorrhiza TaxID=226208 RepID=UPI0025AD94F4|nr:uncharacterized protein LOC131026374 [Salvia miltiorrhiza]
MAEQNVQYMGDFSRPVIGTTSTSAIVFPTAVRNYNLKPNDSNLLPLFHGMPSEDALQFIRDFCTQVQTFPLLELTEDQLRLKCLPYALKDRARTWLLSLPPNSITTWGEASEKFMLKYYPNHKTQEIRSQIMNFMQGADEPFHEAWERFQELLRQCPQHQLPPVMLMQFFYDGLIQTAQFMVDSTAGGNIARKTADELKGIFETLAASSQQKSVRGRRVEANAVAPNNELQKQVADLMRQVQHLTMNQVKAPPVHAPPAEGCSICGDFGHGTNACHRMGECTPEGEAEVYAAQSYPGRPQFEQRPIFNQGQQSSNSGWRAQQQNYTQAYQQQQPPQYQQYQQFPMQQGNFQQQQQYQNASQQCQKQAQPQKPSLEDTMQSFMEMTKQNMESQSATIKRLETTVGQLTGALNQLQQEQPTGKFLNQDKQPRQAHAVAVIKETTPITTGKWRSRTVQAIKATQCPSEPLPPVTVAPDQPPTKQGDPGSFIVDISLGGVEKVLGMLDLGAAVNLMPLDIFERLGNKELKCTNIKIELADGSISSPRGLVEDVEVVVRGISVLVDFVVLDEGKGIRGENGHLVLLGRPFLATTHTRIDVGTGTVSMVGAGRAVTFSVFDQKPTTPTRLIQICSYVETFNALEENYIVQELLNKLPEEDEIVEEFLANLQDEADIEQELLEKLQEEDDKEQGLLCALLLEEKLDEVESLNFVGCVDRGPSQDMSMDDSFGGPAAATQEDVFTRALRQLELQSDFG